MHVHQCQIIYTPYTCCKYTHVQISAAVQPRALLFQQCQRARWAQPRYEKLPGGGMQYCVSAAHASEPIASTSVKTGHVRW